MATPIRIDRHDPAAAVDKLHERLITTKAPIENDGRGYLIHRVNDRETYPIRNPSQMALIVDAAGIRFRDECDNSIDPPRKLMKVLLEEALIKRWFLTASPWTTIRVRHGETAEAVEAVRVALIELKAPICCGRNRLIWRDNAREAMRLSEPYQLEMRIEALGIRFVDQRGMKARRRNVKTILRTFIKMAQGQRWFPRWEPLPNERLYG